MAVKFGLPPTIPLAVAAAPLWPSKSPGMPQRSPHTPSLPVGREQPRAAAGPLGAVGRAGGEVIEGRSMGLVHVRSN